MTYAVTGTTTDAYPTLTLSDAAAALQATVAPGLGMLVCSLRHRGAELLGQRRGLAAYAAHGSTMGIPLLHPWANRLADLTYTAAGVRVRLDPASPLLHRDGAGLPMHGLLAAHPGWELVEEAADDAGARVAARLDFAADPTLMAAFPFAHELTLALTLRDATLTVALALRATGTRAVPVAFGFHPYLQLPDVPRAAWWVEAPVRARAVLDARQIPTGARAAVTLAPGPLGARTFDDLFPVLATPTRFVLAGGGRRLTVAFDDAYPCAQLFAPAADAVVCFEPMTAPTNALVSGDGLRLVPPGDTFHAAFRVHVARADP